MIESVPFNSLKMFVAFCSFFHVASLMSIGVDNQKVWVDNRKAGVDNEKALDLTNSTVFHKGKK